MLSFLYSQLSHPYMTNGKTIALTRQTFVGKVMSLLFNTLPRYVIGFLQRNNHLLISWLQSPSAVILEPPKNKVCHCFYFFPVYLPWSDGTGCHERWVLSQTFHSPVSPSWRGPLVPPHFLPLELYHLHIWGCWYFSWQSWFQYMLHPDWHFTWCSLHVS